MAQLAINLGAIIVAGTAVLAVQRLLYRRRRRRHRHEPERRAAATARRSHRRAERRPDLDLRPDLLDHRAGELRRGRVAAEVDRSSRRPRCVSSTLS